MYCMYSYDIFIINIINTRIVFNILKICVYVQYLLPVCAACSHHGFVCNLVSRMIRIPNATLGGSPALFMSAKLDI